MTHRFDLCLALTFVTSSTTAQELIWQREGVENETAIGHQVVVLGDTNDDGFDDLLHFAVRIFPNGTWYRLEGELWILSGRDGSTLSTRPHYGVQRPYIIIAATGDMDGDGIADYADTVLDIRHPPLEPSFVEVRSGRDHSLIWRVNGIAPRLEYEGFGSRMVGNLDIDGDRRPDLVVGAPGWQPGLDRLGRVYAYDNRGRLLYRVDGTTQLALGGFSWHEQGMGVVGDVNNDGRDDYVLGGLDYVNGVGAGIVLSGLDGRVLVIGRSSLPLDGIGWTTDGCGDMDRDGTPDFCAGSESGGGQVGSVEVFSGRTGQPIRRWSGSGQGWSLRSGGFDFDRDGVPDVVTRSFDFAAQTGYVNVYSGREGATIHAVPQCPANFPSCGPAGYGRHLAVGGPQPKSPYPVFAIGHVGYHPYYPRWSGAGQFTRGRVMLFRGSPPGVEGFASPCRGTLASAPQMGVRSLGAAGVRLHLSNADPTGSAVLLLGLSRDQLGSGVRLPLPLSALGFSDCWLYTSVELLAGVPVGQNGVAAGYASFDLPLPLAVPGREQVRLFGQWVALGSGARWPGGLSDATLWHH